ncbi:MAG TPA: hypothetical protein VM143_07650 [Acidimicrobiales bacterium]|nr:hypothetical protein [Acidimicrobiales bacterium]
MDLRDVLDDYVVTAVPGRDALLSVEWSEADGDVDESDETDGPLTLAILDDYRITRVPKAS